MTIVGMGDYTGTKNVTFKIAGTEFTSKNVSVENFQNVMQYSGKALIQDDIVVKINGKELTYGKDYTISYKNNMKKGTATMTINALSSSGYSGSLIKKFNILASELKDIVTVMPSDNFSGDKIVYENESIKFEGYVPYTKGGAKISGRILLANGNAILKEGIDYTVSYVNNKTVTTDKNGIPAMNIKGKGNYAGNLAVNFVVTAAEMTGNENLTVISTAQPYALNKGNDYQYQPKIKIMDGNKSLSVLNDYTIEYKNCSQADVTTYLQALKNGNDVENIKPYAVISAKSGSGYAGSITEDLTIYENKLTVKNLYIVVSDDTNQVKYNGCQVKPDVKVYYGDSKAVEAARNAKENDDEKLTDVNGTYHLMKLSEKRDYVLDYGSNVIAGINKGSVTVTGICMYGGNVKAKFTIWGRNVYNESIGD
jgi:hypothetical protein